MKVSLQYTTAGGEKRTTKYLKAIGHTPKYGIHLTWSQFESEAMELTEQKAKEIIDLFDWSSSHEVKAY